MQFKKCSFRDQNVHSTSSNGFSFHCVQTVFRKQLKLCAWKSHCQALSGKDCDICMQIAERIFWAWYEDSPDLFGVMNRYFISLGL